VQPGVHATPEVTMELSDATSGDVVGPDGMKLAMKL